MVNLCGHEDRDDEFRLSNDRRMRCPAPTTTGPHRLREPPRTCSNDTLVSSLMGGSWALISRQLCDATMRKFQPSQRWWVALVAHTIPFWWHLTGTALV